ncbi:hypothetical protein OO010_12525 [Flavobacteriaceae bacterium KMM 6898]|nr:hypothetical protein [Flavobacteriaceae bacterium KMM 6898]
MKKLLFLFCSILFLTSCDKEISNIESNELAAIASKDKLNKVSICHYNPHNDTYKTKFVNEIQLARHLEHGDKIGECGFTYVPDDLFEQNLIDLGYDDVLDDYVLTDNIKNLTTLVLDRGNYGEEPMTIYDFTGLQDFTSLEELEFRKMEAVDNLDLSSNLNLKKLVFTCSIVGDINIENNVALEELWISAGFDLGSCYAFWTSDLDLSGNINLKTLFLGNVIPPGVELDAILASVPSIEVLHYSFVGISGGQSMDLRSNVNLKMLNIGTEFILESLLIDIRNGANHILEGIYLNTQLFISDVCIQVNDPTFVEGIVFASNIDGPVTSGYTVTTDCSGSLTAKNTYSKSNQRSSERFFNQTERKEYDKRFEEYKEKVKQFNSLRSEFINRDMN